MSFIRPTEPEIAMRAYCGGAVYEAQVRATEEGVEEFRQSVLELLLHTNCFALISIPGGKA